MNLPEEFRKQYSELLGTEYESFEKALLNNRSFGLRINPLKFDITEDILESVKDELGIIKTVPWAVEGFYYDNDKRPGKSPLHEGGAIYIQEPSAMAVVSALDPKPGERILDLCAAPGGKTTHIAGKLGGEGLLIANEIVPDRAKVLSRNVERLGVTNCIVTNEAPDALSARFSGFFHRIVVDAPCSGEGMFRKEDIAITEWSPENVKMCAERQLDIIECAAQMIMPGGTLVYSTCTFEPDEDERLIERFLELHEDWHIEPIEFDNLLSNGHAEWTKSGNKELSKTVRIWPHLNEGEGHFMAKLVKNGQYTIIKTGLNYSHNIVNDKKPKNKASKGKKDNNTGLEIDEILSFLRNEIFSEDSDIYKKIDCFNNNLSLMGENVFFLPTDITVNGLKGIKTVRCGLHLCELKKNRFEPSHAFAMALNKKDVKNSYECDYETAVKYLRGESIVMDCDIPSGSYVLICYKDVSLGWAKYSNSMLKNHYPKGLRRNLEM